MNEVKLEDDEFSICTEKYYNELGKLDQAPLLTKKERKHMKKRIVNSMFRKADVILGKDKVSNKVDKVTTKEKKNKFYEEHHVGFARKIAKPFKQISLACKNVCTKTWHVMANALKVKPKAEVLEYTQGEAEQVEHDTFIAFIDGNKSQENSQIEDDINGEEITQNE